MRWTKRQENLIKQVIKRYKQELKVEKRNRVIWNAYRCPFCTVYRIYADYHKCEGCPNNRIAKLLGVYDPNRRNPNINTCSDTLHVSRFKKLGTDFYVNFDYYKISARFIKLRISFWIDALKLSKKDFSKKWGSKVIKIKNSFSSKVS